MCERRLSPPHHEELSKPEYLRDEVSGNSVATLILVEKEQLRLLRRLPAYCAWIRGEAKDSPTPRANHDAFVQVNKHIKRFQTTLLSQRLTPEDTEWLLNQQRREELLVALDETCLELCEASGALGPEAQHIRLVVVEALDTFLLTAVEGADRHDVQELDMLDTMTRDRGPAHGAHAQQHLTTADRVAADGENATACCRSPACSNAALVPEPVRRVAAPGAGVCGCASRRERVAWNVQGRGGLTLSLRSSRRMPGGGFSLEVQHLGEDLGWGAEVQGLSRGVIVGLGDAADVTRLELIEIGAPGQEASEATDGVFDAALLPRSARVTEEGGQV